MAFNDHLAVGDKAVPASRHGDDKPVIALALAKYLSECGNLNRQITFFDKLIGPDPFEELFSGHDAAMVFHQGEQDIERLRTKSDRLFVPGQEPSSGIEFEIAEFEMLGRYRFHMIPGEFSFFNPTI